MNQRQEQVLNTIILTYVKTAEPVSSSYIAKLGTFSVSPATIRNDMAVLEDAGYIAQPHTSSGRVPTEKGYRYFIEHSVQERDLTTRTQEQMRAAVAQTQNERHFLKEIARMLASLSTNASFVAFEPRDVYTTGLTYLFSQPEYNQHELVHRMSETVDKLDEVLENLFGDMQDSVAILIGSKNPFGADCSTILMRYRATQSNGILGLLGPVRMDYQRNVALLRHSQHLIDSYL